MPTLAELAKTIDATWVGRSDICIESILPLEFASSSDLSFFINPKYLNQAQTSQAAALLVDVNTPYMDKLKQGHVSNFLLHENPYLALAKLTTLFYQNQIKPAAQGIHESVVFRDKSSITIGRDVSIGPYSVIEANVHIADGVCIGAHAVIDTDCTIGAHSYLAARVTLLSRCVVGERCVIGSGAVIGSAGFGYAEDPKACPGQRFFPVPQLGFVHIEDNVEIGANTTIDRATFGATVIKSGTKIDNLVMLAHNVQIGQDTIVAAQAGVAGSTRVGDRVMVGGQAGIVGHVSIGNDVKINAQSGVSCSVDAAQLVSGSPHRPFKQWQKIEAILDRLDAMYRLYLKLK